MVKNTLLNHKRTAVAVALASALAMMSFNVEAKKIVDVNQYFQFVAYEAGDIFEIEADDIAANRPVTEKEIIEDTVSDESIEILKKGVEYFTPLFGNLNTNSVPVKIALVQKTQTDSNATAYSPALDAGPYRYTTELTAALFKNIPKTLSNFSRRIWLVN
ncbi:MAG: hypothetical protein ACI4NE_07290, partial [Succinivibrio sp.]